MKMSNRSTHRFRQLLAVLLAVLMLVSCLPVSALADDAAATKEYVISSICDLDETEKNIMLMDKELPDMDQVTEVMPQSITVISEGEKIDIPVTWESDTYYDEECYKVVFYPAYDENVYITDSSVQLPMITVEIKAREDTMASLASVTGSSNEDTIYNYLRNTLSIGCAGACSVLGNMYVESSLRPTAYNSSENAWGLCQWEGSRLTELQSRYPSNWKTLNAQLSFLKDEFGGADYAGPKTLSYLKGVSDDTDGAKAGALYFAQYFERCASSTYSKRQTWAGTFHNDRHTSSVTYTNRFYPGAGSGSMADQVVTYGVATALSKNTFTRAGYTFAGWHVYRESDKKRRFRSTTDTSQDLWSTDSTPPSGYTWWVYGDGTTVAYTSTVNGDVVQFWAQWSPITYTINYNANGGSNAPASQTKQADNAATIAAAPSGAKAYTITYGTYGGTISSNTQSVSCTFTGWNTASDGSGTSYAVGSSYKNTANLTLYAQWANPTGDTLYTPYRDGLTFAGWYTHQATDSTFVSNGATITGNTTLYARWQPTTGTNINLGNNFAATITNLMSGTNLQKEDSGNIAGYAASGADNQVWKFTRLDDGSYIIASKQDSNLVLTSNGPKNQLSVSAYTGAASQHWYLYDAGSGAYYLQCASETVTIIDLDNGSSDDGTKINSYYLKDGNMQRWLIMNTESEHTYVTSTVAPTCTEAGYITYTCTGCGESKTEIIPAIGHSYTAEVTEPTCTEKGYTTYRCVNCGDIYVSDETNALGHEYQSTITEPTCTESGYTTYTCSRCGNKYTADEVPAAGHNYDEGNVLKKATCTDDGLTVYTCSICGDTKTETISAVGHNFTAYACEATCEEGGITGNICDNCGIIEIESETTALGHAYTYTDNGDGTHTGTCSRCSNTFTEDHTYVDGVCSACGAKKASSGSLQIVTQPNGGTATIGQTVKISVEAVNAKSYQWYYSKDGVNWIKLYWTGAKTDTLSVEYKASRAGFQYKCLVNGTDGASMYTDSTSITLGTAPDVVIIQQPATVCANVGETVSFSIAAENAISYQWFYSKDDGTTWTKLYWDGYNTDTLTFEVKKSRYSYVYYCKMTDGNGKAYYSNRCYLRQPLSLTKQPKNVTANIGDTVNLTVSAIGAASYQWYYSSDNGASWKKLSWTGAKSDTLTVAVTQTRCTYVYHCVLTGYDGTEVTTNAVKLTAAG